MAYVPIPYIFPLLKISFTPIKGDHGPLCILAIPVTVVQPRFVNGVKQREECGRGVSRAREIFQHFSMKLAFSCTLDTIIRGSLCIGIDQFLSLFLFSFFS